MNKGMMMGQTPSCWHPLSMLPTFSGVVSDMLDAATNQQTMLLRIKEKPQHLDEATSLFILRLYAKQQANIGRYKAQCQQWRKEELTSRQKKVIERTELQINALEDTNHQILFLSKYLSKHTSYEITSH